MAVSPGITVDPSVWERWHKDPAYRPLTLVNKGLTPLVT